MEINHPLPVASAAVSQPRPLAPREGSCHSVDQPPLRQKAVPRTAFGALDSEVLKARVCGSSRPNKQPPGRKAEVDAE